MVQFTCLMAGLKAMPCNAPAYVYYGASTHLHMSVQTKAALHHMKYLKLFTE